METKKKGGLTALWLIVAVIAVLIGSTFSLIRNNLNLGLDLQGGFEILYEIAPLNEGQSLDMTAVINSIQKRVDVLGVNEPQITVEGTDRIRVQLAGVADQETARSMLGTTANLTFRDVDDNLLADSSIIQEGGASLAYQDGQPIVSLKIADSAKFGEITSEVSAKTGGNNIMIIWLDWEEGDTYRAELQKSQQGLEPKYISAASVNSVISGDCIIQGRFTDAEARTLANLINSGSLPVKMTEISSNVVSAQYGADALHRTAIAGAIGVLAVILFMIYQYRVPGLIAGVMLAAYIWAIFGLYSLMGAVFTLPGIGALVLGVGMTVDANIITYERIRQELYKGRSVRSAVAEGQKLSFTSILDAQLTTLIAGLIMYWFGNGAVKGFATMLVITVLMTLAVNVALSRFLLNIFVNSGVADDKPEWFGVKRSQIPDLAKGEEQFYFGFKKRDFLGMSKHLIRTSLIIVAAALCLSIFNAVRGSGFMNLGIDFASGTKLTVSSENAITVDEVRSEMENMGYTSFSYQSAGDSTVYATTKDSLTVDQLTEIKETFIEKYGQEPGDNVVTPVVGRELVRNAVILTLVAWAAMLAYIAFRYEWDYALGCLVALVHDVFIVLSAFAICRFEVNIELISVLLTIIGYSINNSIVVFDRVRSTVANAKSIKKDSYGEIVNEALNSTFRMSLFSSISTLLPVIFLILLGSRSIFTFNFAMLVGMIAGTFSSLFIAPSLWWYLRTHYEHKEKQKKQKKAEKEQLDEYTIKGINA
ncbi:MAG: protein translocase subunit SecD [Erysipelotrichaceae bacterium]|nr:protein translocase subunit SecD [Erysipelotrichaceae bacterium]